MNKRDETLMSQIGNTDGTLDELNKGMEKIIEDIGERLLPLAYTRAGIQVSDSKKRLRVVFKPVIISEDINAYYDPDKNEITVNDHLMVFYHKMLKVFVAMLTVGVRKTSTLDKVTIPSGRILSACRELMQAYCEKKLMAQEGFQLSKLGEGQKAVLCRLVRSCECFDVGHELGHFVIKNTKADIAEHTTATKTVKDYLEGRADLCTNVKLKLIKPWSNEICADLIGLQLSLAQSNTEPYNHWENYKQWLCAGAEISLLLMWMFEEFEDRLKYGSNIPPSETHPPGDLRREAIRSSSGTLSPSEEPFDFGKTFSTFANGLLEELLTKTKDGHYTLTTI